jgi:hypothetical protein
VYKVMSMQENTGPDNLYSRSVLYCTVAECRAIVYGTITVEK